MTARPLIHNLSTVELAELRLKVWQALQGWGVSKTTKIGEAEIPEIQPWDWETRKQRADDLLRWLLSPVTLDEGELP